MKPPTEKDLIACKELLALFHPSLETDDNLIAKLCFIRFPGEGEIWGKVKDYGYVSLRIENGNDISNMSGAGHSFEEFEERHKFLRFRVSRISLDRLYIPSEKNLVDFNGFEFTGSESYKLRDQYTPILLKAGYRLKTLKEWIDTYYSE